MTIRERRHCHLQVKLVDISLNGCRILAGFRLRPEIETVIRIPGFEPLAATIVWSSNGEAGLRFAKLLHPAVVAHIVKLSVDEEPEPGAEPSPGLGWVS